MEGELGLGLQEQEVGVGILLKLDGGGKVRRLVVIESGEQQGLGEAVAFDAVESLVGPLLSPSA